MAKYDVKFACGHTAEVELFGPNSSRQYEISRRERMLCPECYKAEKDAKAASECEEVRMSYAKYKNEYASCKTKSDSYDKATKSIIVFVPNDKSKLADASAIEKMVQAGATTGEAQSFLKMGSAEYAARLATVREQFAALPADIQSAKKARMELAEKCLEILKSSGK